jgi:HrpA-like RNA helicase
MDVLCLLCRRLLSMNSHTRLILMSATLAAGLYQEYFNVKDPVIYVGARRFPVEDVFLSDLPRRVKLSGNVISKVASLSQELLAMKCMRPPSIGYMEKLFAVVANLAVVIGKPGTSVLIFVSGMNDIIGISEIIEQFHIPGTVFTCLPIHGDIPFEDQMNVFDVAKPNEVKIIISTNAAESSVTLPDVDNVICLGLCKQIEYNPISHRQILVPTWISRASAIQRAGRTGRLRPGTVYRMYEKSTYSFHMEAFERGEILRIPLDSVILTLKKMLSDECITEVLASCLEPPNTSTIDRSFQSLFRSNLISEASDVESCKITKLGLFVSHLGIDLALGSLIGLGIQFGVGAEAILIAGILSFPKGPWIQSSPLIHGTEDFNGTFFHRDLYRVLIIISYFYL